MSGPYNSDCPWCNDDIYNSAPTDADIPCFCKTQCGSNVCGYKDGLGSIDYDEAELAAWRKVAESHGEVIELSKHKANNGNGKDFVGEAAATGSCLWCHTNKPCTKEACSCELYCGKSGCRKPNPNAKAYNGGTQAWQASGGGYNATSYMCDKDAHPQVLFKWNGIAFSGQKKSDVEKLSFDPKIKRLVINASNSSIYRPTAASKLVDSCPNNGLKALESPDYIYTPPIAFDDLSLNWSDGKAFPATFSWWTKLLELIETEGYNEVVVCCVGGHGRTGTALAILLMLTHELQGEGGPSIVAESWIKTNYCKKAIETADQQYYLDYIATIMMEDQEPKVEAESEHLA